TAGLMTAFIIGHDIHCVDHLLKRESIFGSGRPLSYGVDHGIDGIRRALTGTRVKFGGAIKREDTRKAVTRGALALYGSGQAKAARELISTLRSENTFDDALTDLV